MALLQILDGKTVENVQMDPQQRRYGLQSQTLRGIDIYLITELLTIRKINNKSRMSNNGNNKLNKNIT